jgi:DNA polymerase II large subunit
MLIDYLRECFGYAKYDPTEEEVRRYVTENYDYHERVTNLQYLPTEEEIVFLAQNIPIQISGEPSEKREVSNYKDLPRIDTNFIRGGMCLIFSEGLAQKAAKGLRVLEGIKSKGFTLSGWDFLKEYVDIHKKREKGKVDHSPTYLKDLVAGRPVFGYPSQSGGFRFRYGRSRTSGFSAFSLHPATLALSDKFIAIGTQLKIEKPTKGGVVSICDTIEGPIVKLRNGSVKKFNNVYDVGHIYSDIEEILYFGDLLFPFSDLANRNQELISPGYVEEWWALELEKASQQNYNKKNINPFNTSFETAINLSEEYNIPLHPKYTFFWSQISHEHFFTLLEWLFNGSVDGKIILPYSRMEKETFAMGKRALELLGLEHEVTLEHAVISKQDSKSLFLNLGLPYGFIDEPPKFISEFLDKNKFEKKQNVLDIIQSVCRFIIRDKAGSFIGARMGRPEKSKLRALTGSPNVIFPVGQEGGRLRSVQECLNVKYVFSSFPLYFCELCQRESIYRICELCNSLCKQQFADDTNFFENNEKKRLIYSERRVDVPFYYHSALKRLGLKAEEAPSLVKGVRGTSSEEHIIEHLAKGILRSKHHLSVNKDGTIRFDCTEMPLTHFKPKEIFVSAEKLRELGYIEDIYGAPLKNEDQILELKPHDIVLPCCPESPDERADEVFIRIAKFIDELLEKFYHIPTYYHVEKREDLVGKLATCMAPHNCAGVISRIIGFSQTQGLLASPYMHAAMRRDCDGDEAAVMLLLDVLLNFSRSFLPSHRGGTQDAPLVLNSKIDAGEVDEQILDFELVWNYPLELYEKASQKLHSSSVKIQMIRDRLKNGEDPFTGIGYTHETINLNAGVLCSNYKKLATMQEKVNHQMVLVEKLRSVEARDVARLIIEKHFIRDIKGNLRKFSMQQFRCVKCNEKFRRPPLSGICNQCGGKIIFTISEGTVIKYLEPAIEIVTKYDVDPYIRQSLEITKRAIESIFGKNFEKQEAIQKWF